MKSTVRIIFWRQKPALMGDWRVANYRQYLHEQIIGQSGQGFVVGLAIAAYEQAAIVLIIVAKYSLPFLEENLPAAISRIAFWPANQIILSFLGVLYTAVNLTAVLWLGVGVNALTGGCYVCHDGLALLPFLFLYGGESGCAD